MIKTIYIHNKPHRLAPADLIQSGGEGLVFALGQTAVKLYHQPDQIRQKKLQHWLSQGQPLPANVLAPCAPVQDRDGRLIGLQMARLPAGANSIKQLSSPGYWLRQALTLPQVLPLLQQIHQTLSSLHQRQIVVGDLNDTNIYFTLPAGKPPKSFWIDVDSFQTAQFPCPVAMLSFLDPALYHVTDFSQRPYFTPLTDWYAFTVLLVKSLLQVHPYGGVHRQYKSLRSRAAAGISIFNSSVQLPPAARPPDLLPDDLLHYLHGTFERGHRKPFPARLLAHFAQNLQICGRCRLAYPANRSGCPACLQPTPLLDVPAPAAGCRTLLRVDGFIEAVFVQPNGRLLIIYRQGREYRLVRAGIGGRLSDDLLFSGAAGYRFGAFTRPNGQDYLVVNPPYQAQLLLLDIHLGQLRQVTLLETAMFRDAAVFAVTPNYLYRVSGGWIMRGAVRSQAYLEEAIGTAHRAQTQLFGSPLSNSVAGFHRIFASLRYFVISADSAERQLDPPSPQDSPIQETAVVFGPKQVGLVQRLGAKDRSLTRVVTFTENGKWQRSQELVGKDWETAVNHFPFIDPLSANFPLRLGQEDRLHFHPQGWLIQKGSELKLLTGPEK